MKLLFECLETRPAPFDLKLAVANNLQRLLGSRGFFAEAADVGNADESGPFDVMNCAMPNVVELADGSRPALEAYGARLLALVAHYEPRLREPSVSIEGGGAMPRRLIVSGSLDVQGVGQVLRFPVELRAHG